VLLIFCLDSLLRLIAVGYASAPHCTDGDGEKNPAKILAGFFISFLNSVYNTGYFHFEVY
jgi:hypothetical protein